MPSADTPLVDLPVLLLDCQASGASLAHGQLIDVAWCVVRARELGQHIPLPEGTLVALEQGARLPKRIKEMTGISKTMLKGAPTLDAIATMLARTLQELSLPIVPVAHYARFERPFIQDLLERAELEPEQVLTPYICTHKIAQRLMPGLPRRGLRAIAGYFGEMLSDEKRASTHVQATAVIWREVVELLTEEEEVATLGELRHWLATKKVDRSAAREFPLPREVRLGLPRTPGIYRMLNKRGDVLYVGKATNLKQRVNSYFRGKKGGGERKLEMATQVWQVDVEQVGSPLEAALLEVDAIKLHDPPYNKQLRRKNRAVWYTSPHDLTQIERLPDALTLGPFAPKSALEEMRDVILSLRHNTPALSLFWGLEDEDIYAQGVALLHERRPCTALPQPPWLELGEQLWLEHLAYLEQRALEAQLEDELDDLLEDEEEEESEPRVLEWTPQLVAYGLERIISRMARRARRGAFLQLLVHADICWRAPHYLDEPRRLLSVRDGKIATLRQLDEAHDISLDQKIPAGQPALHVLAELDTYDRMSVLLGELRRVVRDSPQVQLRCAGGEVLAREALMQAMRMF